MSIKIVDERIKCITKLAEQFVVYNRKLPLVEWADKGIIRKGLKFDIDIECEQMGYDEKDTFHKEWKNRERHTISVIVAGDHSVFVNVKDQNNLNDYENTSNHDSCWRVDGFDLIKHFAWDMYDRVFSKTPEDEKPTMNESIFFIWDVFGKFMTPVEIITKNKKNDYGSKIVEMKEIEFTDLFERE